MLSSPWNLVLTVAFVLTGVVCAVRLASRRRDGLPRRGLSSHDVVHLDHGVMSVAMILMVWFDVQGAAAGVQVALFAALAVALTVDLRGARSPGQRVDLSGHVALNVAMVWMLVAMPLLMAGTTPGGAHAGHTGHGAHGGGVAATATPAWAETVNAGLVVVCAAWALWWLYRAAAHRAHRLHTLCHAVMATGTGGMLVLMGA